MPCHPMPCQPLPHVSMTSYHESYMDIPCHNYNHSTSVVWTWHVNTIRTVRTVQSMKFYMFWKAYRMWYLTHMRSIWTCSICIGIMRMRHMHKSVLKQFLSTLIFEHILIPWINSLSQIYLDDDHCPTLTFTESCNPSMMASIVILFFIFNSFLVAVFKGYFEAVYPTNNEYQTSYPCASKTNFII